MASTAPASAAPSLVSSLTNAAVNVTALREAAWLDLEALLADVPGRICLVIDSSLEGVLKMCITGGSPQLKVGVWSIFCEVVTSIMRVFATIDKRCSEHSSFLRLALIVCSLVFVLLIASYT